MNLNAYSHVLSLILQAIEHLFGMEAAIFDNSATLVVCSKRYLEEKGSTVHKPSILEVIEKDTVTVITPGRMPSCVGCRFNGHCPAKMELLKRIMHGNQPVGVLAFSSFSDEGQKQIIDDIDHFKQIIDDFAQLVSSLLDTPSGHSQSRFESYLHALTSTLPDGFVIVDHSGNIQSMNQAALNAFNGFCLKSINEFLPKSMVSAILSGSNMDNHIFGSDDKSSYSVSSTPVLNDSGEFDGAVIRFSPKLEKPLRNARLPVADAMYGSGTHMRSIKRQMGKIVNSPSCVFISGETGTGKSLLAKSIHYQSYRANKPFVTISCANIPESLFESELFGYEAGAFTGALKTGKRGKLETAEDGTLFLDEISEIPMSIQAKLLGVLQDRHFERVGGTTSIPVNARIISASNADISQRIAENRFRSDLFYRLNVINIEMIPLQDRIEDLPELLNAFLNKFNQMLNAHITGFAPEVLELFRQYRWPGNIRQLENVVEYCVNMAEDSTVTLSDLPAYFLNDVYTSPPLKDPELDKISELLDLYGWDVAGKERTAKELGISLRTLYRKIERISQSKGYLQKKGGSCNGNQ